MNLKEDFIAEFQKLCRCAQVSPDVDDAQVYWDELKNLPYLTKTLRLAKMRDYSKSMYGCKVPRLPTPLELKKLHIEEVEPAQAREETNLRMALPEPQKGNPEEAVFLMDCVTNTNYKAEQIYDFFDKIKLKKPENYLGFRKDKFKLRAFLNELLQPYNFEERKIPKQVKGWSTAV